MCRRARAAAAELATASAGAKDAALLAVADALEAATDARSSPPTRDDLERGRADGLAEGLLDRLRLDRDRLAAIAAAVRTSPALPDPVGEVVRGSTLPNGLRLRQVRVPMGVVGMIYEARPNVTVDAAVLAVKSGNAAVLRGGSAARDDERGARRRWSASALAGAGLPADAVALDRRVGPGRRRRARCAPAASSTCSCPRGGAGLIRTVVETSTVPVIETGHRQLPRLRRRSRRPRPGARDHAQRQDPPGQRVQRRRDAARARATPPPRSCRACCPRCATPASRLHVDDAVTAAAAATRASTPCRRPTRTGPPSTSRSTWPSPSSPSLDAAVEHIRRWSSGHTEAIVTTDLRAADALRRRGRLGGRRGQRLDRASPTAPSSASAPRSASPPRSCTPAARWAWRS